jgi:phospholipid/cholesterol/gamma-HCH transport system ATP-binding protein
MNHENAIQKMGHSSQQSGSESLEKARVVLRHTYMNYNDQKILEDVSMEVYANEVVAVVGPSGTGKSTLIRIIAGLIEPDAGEVGLSSDSIGFVFQNGALFSTMTVYENLIFVLERTIQLSVSEMDQRIDEVLNLVGMGEERDKSPNQLSGGMQKRVAIARALAIYPDIMLYDEPTTGLDPMFANKLEKDLKRFNTDHQMASIIVTHELPAIHNMADRVIMFYQGKIVYEGSQDDFFTTHAPYALQFRTRQEAGPIDV